MINLFEEKNMNNNKKSKRKTKIKGNKLTSRQLKREILKFFRRHPKKRFNPKQIGKKLKVENNKDSIQYAMDRLVEENQLIALGDYKYQIKRKAFESGKRSTHEGDVDMTQSGSAYIVCADLETDVHVAAKHLNSALHGDRVRISVWQSRGRRRPEGEVLAVLERAKEHFLGTYWHYPKFGVVVPDGNVSIDIVVEHAQNKEAKDGEKVVVQVTDWTNKQYRRPIGKVTSVLGAAGSNEIEMKAILINKGFQLDFPELVIEESEKLSTEITQAEIDRRWDMRDITTFTIDPDTAKDFDDALSIRYLEKGECEVGVHIADVTHYVKPDSRLDKEAYDRSTSVYLVDRVLPMLPEKLSNELCSLRPNEDKLTFSAVFVFDKNDRIINRWFGKSVIHSDRRFTYEEAQQVLVSGKGDFAPELRQLNRLSKLLRKKRFKKGAINFETDEVKFRLDEAGVPIDVYIKERKEAHMLIEDFMLLANREVATFITKKGKDHEIPFIYRVHDEPDPAKVEELATFAKEMGFEMNISTPEEIARSYNRLIEQAQKDRGLKLLEPIAIRTMSKAVYSSDNIGHYGLGFDNYSHFTSPIRRYSDVIAHRLLEKNLGKGQIFRTNKTALEEQCEHISRQERKAMEAERESVKYKQVEFIKNHVGETFNGYVSGIMDRGLFVELQDNRCEGMVSFDTMGEIFEVAESRLRAKGLDTSTVYRMGDAVQVRIVRADLATRRIDMEMAKDGTEEY